MPLDSAQCASVMETVRGKRRTQMLDHLRIVAIGLLVAILPACIGTVYPLHQAVSNGDQTTVRLLIDRGDNLNTQNTAGFTPLMDAAAIGHLGIARILLEHGADPTLVNRQGETALVIARKYDHTLVCELLEQALTQRAHRTSR